MASDDFYLVLPSNSSMSMYPNNTLAQYVTNLPRRISLSGEWECGLTEIHYPHDWYNVRGARLTVEHNGKMDTDASSRKVPVLAHFTIHMVEFIQLYTNQPHTWLGFRHHPSSSVFQPYIWLDTISNSPNF